MENRLSEILGLNLNEPKDQVLFSCIMNDSISFNEYMDFKTTLLKL